MSGVEASVEDSLRLRDSADVTSELVVLRPMTASQLNAVLPAVDSRIGQQEHLFRSRQQLQSSTVHVGHGSQW